ncbi:MAG: hypothetical protein Q4C23_02520 [Mycoplasmatota bacterium]|nr:hypothetical protein [Mycoplasmatota bacterium]
MDKKKLIGTIIGVTMFAALIAGATFAWLTFSATITNGSYNTGTKNFVINYDGGTALTEMPMLTVSGASAVASSGAKVISLSAGLASGSTPGNLTITLNTTATGADSNGHVSVLPAMRYSVAIGTGTPTAPKTITSNTQALVLSGTSTTQKISSTTATTIKVYFWLEASDVTTTMLGASYSGYISASATQTES